MSMTPAALKTASYLGSGAYVHASSYHVVLTANHHDPDKATGAVYLDPYALANLERWLASRKAEQTPNPE